MREPTKGSEVETFAPGVGVVLVEVRGVVVVGPYVAGEGGDGGSEQERAG